MWLVHPPLKEVFICPFKDHGYLTLKLGMLGMFIHDCVCPFLYLDIPATLRLTSQPALKSDAELVSIMAMIPKKESVKGKSE